MNSDVAVSSVIAALDRTGIPFMLVGSLSSSYYGIPRSTNDADFVVQLGDRHAEEIVRNLTSDLRLDPQMSFETATLTFRHIIHVANSPFQIELFHLSDDPHDQERFRRRLQVKYGSWDTWIATAEDVIITKLRWLQRSNRGKDREDVRDVILVQQSQLDWPYIESWCDVHGTRSLLEQIREFSEES